jgi:hypothetical protein
MEIFANGHGGKHRDTDQARTWRSATSTVAAAILAQNPEMGRAIVQFRAEDETALYLRTAARNAR